MVNVRTGRRYRKGRADEHYDTIIIGSGIGGLVNAALLSLLGKKVCVLEQHYTAGGFTHSYEREGYEWDVGVHYIGEVHNEYSTLRRVFDVISQGRLKWAEMDPAYDRIILGREELDFVAGRKNFTSNLIKRFPEEKYGIESYVKLIRHVSTQTPRFFAAQAMPAWLGRIYNLFRPLLVKKEFFKTTREVLEGLTQNQTLISFLTGQWGDYGQAPRDSAFLIHSLIAKHYMSGAAYPVGGSSSIAREIIPTIQQNGGEVFTYAEVEKVLIKKNRAYGVCLKKGGELYADTIVSDAGFMNTVKKLLPRDSIQKHGMDGWLKQEAIQYSSATICLYAGFKGSKEALGLTSTNLWIYPDEHHEKNIDDYRCGKTKALPLIYISFPSTKDPQWDARYPGKSTVEIVSVANMSEYSDWQGTTWHKRGNDYEAKKEALSQKLLSVLFERLPQLKDALDYYELSTPLSTQFYQLNDQGEIYGLDHYVDRFKKPFLHPQTPIKNLYMTGADVLTAGVGGALMGGLMTTYCMQGLSGARKVTKLLKD